MIISRKNNRFLIIFAIILLAVCMFATTAEAASKKTKALNAYNKLLSKNSFTVNKYGKMTFYTSHCSFGIAYIDKDSVPELIIYNPWDSYHAAGYGTIFTYKGGKVRKAADLSMNGESLGYYKKKGVIVDNYASTGTYVVTVKRLSSGKLKIVASYSQRMKENGKFTAKEYWNADGKKIKKATYKKAVKKYAKKTKQAAVKFYENTYANRQSYLK
ncbi:MAG: hypothetical protein K2K56_02665 [Lachnospiraceae bacterium]|nr:hypothetical protein [Lachnospiraceae bacterium]